eukprot:TRINITY_DN27297_c0_g1_i1.p1 TRINITY_DN27297_c0_g1~~TRINITY_DN27297_c0_g1_i1.p1  ORF type:complete len:577 (+),score=116.72 TRINITY_DN27297_c0_g1_i1:147-1877(+)
MPPVPPAEPINEDTIDAADAQAQVKQILQAASGCRGLKNTPALLAACGGKKVIEAAEAHKAEGNALFAEGKYQEAFDAYKRAVREFGEYTEQSLDEEGKKLLVIVYSNASQALLKLPSLENATSEGALALANKALNLDPMCLKARFRRGCAHSNAGDLNLAHEDFKWVLGVDPRNEPAKREMRALARRRSEASPKGDWAKAAGAAVAGLGDPRSDQATRQRGAADAAEAVQRHEELAARMRAAALAPAESTGSADTWKARLDTVDGAAAKLAETVLTKVAELEGRAMPLDSALGQLGGLLCRMNSDERRRYIAADGFITAFRKLHPREAQEFTPKEFVPTASKKQTSIGAVGSVTSRGLAQAACEISRKIFDDTACKTLAERGFVVVDTTSVFPASCVPRLRAELEAVDSIGALKHRDSGGCRSGPVKNSILQARYQGSALLQVNSLMRGLPWEIASRAPLPADDSRLALDLPDDLRVLALDPRARLARVCDANEGSCVWTALFFVNTSWKPGDGGELDLFEGNAGSSRRAPEAIDPRPGRLVVFDCRRWWYEMSVAEESKLMCIHFKIPPASVAR